MMPPLNGTLLNAFPYKDFIRVEDLIYFEGPLLVHYTNHKGQNFLYHWVDNDEAANRWLIYRVTQQNLLNYLRGQEDFKSLLQHTISDLILVVDVNDNGQRILIQQVELEDLPEDYIPADGVYYELSIPEFYDAWTNRAIAELTDSQLSRYERLKNRAIYSNLKPTEEEYGTLPEVPQMVDYLKNMNTSYVEYSFVKFRKKYPATTGTLDERKRLNKLFKIVKKQNVLRGVDFGPGSFGVALAPVLDDNLRILDEEFYNWLKELPAMFQQEVVDVDFTNPDAITLLSQSYTPEELNSFLFPFIKIIENKNYKVARADRHFKPTTNPIRADEAVGELLLENKKKLAPAAVTSPQKELVTIVVEKNVDQDISKMTARQIASNILSSKPTSEYTVEIDTIERNGVGYNLAEKLELTGSLNGQTYKVQEEKTGIEGEGHSSDEAVKVLKERMFRRFEFLKAISKEFIKPDQAAELAIFRKLVQES